MKRQHLAEELDRKIDALLQTSTSPKPATPDSLLQVAAELRVLSSEGFRASLREELRKQADNRIPVTTDLLPSLNPEPAPSFLSRHFAVLPADPRSLFLSFLSHAALVALIASGVWIGHVTLVEKRPRLSDLTYTPLPAGNTDPGGGSGGDRSRTQASRGTPPRFSAEQLAPPAIVVGNEKPKLQADMSVLGPPDLKLPQSKQLGDLLSSNTVMPSNGTGSRAGNGERSGTGIGVGGGPGAGPGYEGGFGGGVFRAGNGVSAPHVIYNPDPEYSDEARRMKYQGNVVLSLIVDPTGNVRQIRIARSLGMGLDEKAVEAVQRWRFAPGMKDGRPVAVQVNVEVNFRLY